MKPVRAIHLIVCFALAGGVRAAETAASIAAPAAGEPSGAGPVDGTGAVFFKALATVALANLNQTYDGTPREVVATTIPPGLRVDITYDGDPAAPTNAGLHAVVATIVSPDYAGSATGTLTIAKAVATVSLGGLVQDYDGAPKAVVAATDPAGLAVNLSYSGVATPPTAPGAYPVAAEIADANYTGAAADTFVIAVTALVRHAPSVYGAVDGSIQVLSAENISLWGNAWVSGDLLVPGLPAVHVAGRSVYAGTEDGTGATRPNDFEVTLENNALLRHVVRRTDPGMLPEVAAPSAPAGTRDVEIGGEAQDAGDFSTLRDLTLTAGGRALAIPPGAYGRFAATNGGRFVVGAPGSTVPAVYQFQNLALAGDSRLEVDGPVILVVAGGMSVERAAGSAAHPEWLTVELGAGGLVLHAGAVFHGGVIAPRGAVVIGDHAVLDGTIEADRLVIGASGLLQDPNL